ncbi:MAG: inorganic phosphate transporter [Oscillospiraceae bacterium]
MLGVIFVNGWTDAPNAIATVVSTRVLSPGLAVKLAMLFNFIGALVMTMISAKVANTLSHLVDFDTSTPGGQKMALIVFAVAMFSIVLWAVMAWYFGIPTSESHALIAGITGGALALGGLKSVHMGEWKKVLIGLGISLILGFIMGYLTTKLLEVIFRNIKRRSAEKGFATAQIFGALAMAFMHGAQDGQKFMGTFVVGIYLYDASMVTQTGGDFAIPFWMVVLCSAVMGIGTSIGGYKIIKTVGMDMVKLQKYQGFAADAAASLCLLFSSVTGIPVSTTHTKTTSIMGVGASRRLSAVNWGVVKEMLSAWILTFPGCGLIAYLMAKLFMFVL